MALAWTNGPGGLSSKPIFSSIANILLETGVRTPVAAKLPYAAYKVERRKKGPVRALTMKCQVFASMRLSSEKASAKRTFLAPAPLRTAAQKMSNTHFMMAVTHLGTRVNRSRSHPEVALQGQSASLHKKFEMQLAPPRRRKSSDSHPVDAALPQGGAIFQHVRPAADLHALSIRVDPQVRMDCLRESWAEQGKVWWIDLDIVCDLSGNGNAL